MKTVFKYLGLLALGSLLIFVTGIASAQSAGVCQPITYTYNLPAGVMFSYSNVSSGFTPCKGSFGLNVTLDNNGKPVSNSGTLSLNINLGGDAGCLSSYSPSL